jgi:flavorubredoxin
MPTVIDEIAPRIYRLSTFVPDQLPGGFTFNQFLVDAEEPLLFHTGMRGLYASVSEAASRVLPLERLRWVSFGHVEADECGSMNSWLAASPAAQVAHGQVGCMVSLADLADRAPRSLDEGEVLDIGGKRLRYLATPHVPHGWDAGVLYEETTGTLLCGDLFTQMGDGPASSDDSPMDATIAAEDAFGYSCLAPSTVSTVRRLAALEPTTLALMHGPAHRGAGGGWLHDLAAAYAERSAASDPVATA